MATHNNMIVWEWEDEMLAWRPYQPHVSNFIEQNQTAGVLNLGPADIKMKHYSIDFTRMKQIRSNTGTSRTVVRHLHPHNSAVASGHVWQFEGDTPGSWGNYASSFADVLEQAYQNKERKLDLRQPPLYMPYKIDLKKMTQTRIETSRVRTIQRANNANPVQYLSDTSGSATVTTPSAVTIFGSSPAGAIGGGGSTFGTSAFSHSTPASSLGSTPNGILGIPGKLSSALSSLTGSLIGSSNPNSGGSTGVVTRGKVNKTHMPSNRKSAGVTKSAAALTKSTGGSSLGATGGARKKTITRLPPYGSFTNKVEAKSKKKKLKGSEFEHIIKPVMKVLANPPKDEDCCVCMSGVDEASGLVDEKHSVAIQLKCSHMFHQSCLKAMYDSGAKDECIQCPTCKAIYGVKGGTCPSGVMTYDILSNSLPGHSDCDTIRVTYDIKHGVQGPEHPNPGQRYATQGFPRIGFLPNSDEGQKVLKLLIKAWQRRLTFTVGTSATTGAQNMVVWNGIHHKTEMTDHSGHGYPAPNFLDNVKLECAAVGVVASDDENDDDVAMDVKSESDDSDL